MEGIQIGIDRVPAHPEISLVKISGYIDTTTSSELERVIQNLLREQRYKIVVDLTHVDYISSAGWGIFISEIKNLRSHRGDLKLACMSESVNEVYELLEFSTILDASESVETAVRLFESAGEHPGETARSTPEKTARPVEKAEVRLGGTPADKPQPAAPRPAPSPAAASPSTPAARPSGLQATPGQESSAAMDARTPAAVGPASTSSPAAAGGAPGDARDFGMLPLIDRIRTLVKMHPDWGAWKLKKELNRLRGQQPKITWAEVRAELRYSGLKSKRARFQFARGR